jgi:hypothetical protein
MSTSTATSRWRDEEKPQHARNVARALRARTLLYGKPLETIPEWVDNEKFQRVAAELLASSGFHAPRHFEHNDHFRAIVKRVYRGSYTPSPSTIEESDTISLSSDESDSSDSDDVVGATKTSERAPTPIANDAEDDVARAKVWSHFCLKLNAVLFAMAGLFFAGVYFCDVCDSACTDGTTPP